MKRSRKNKMDKKNKADSSALGLDVFMDKLSYHFKDMALLELALSHRSFGKKNNERLEFLGDAMLNFIIASELFKRFPEAQEGQLSRLRAFLVKEETLSVLAREMELNLVLKLGVGEKKSGGMDRDSILADALEAVIGAIYLDGGETCCYECVAAWYESRLQGLSLDTVYKDPKSRLQELLQAQQLPIPQYRLLTVKGEEHHQAFVIECSTELMPPIIAEGTSRRRAEQQAAELTLEALRRGY
jgi:ribonuclease-3